MGRMMALVAQQGGDLDVALEQVGGRRGGREAGGAGGLQQVGGICLLPWPGFVDSLPSTGTLYCVHAPTEGGTQGCHAGVCLPVCVPQVDQLDSSVRYGGGFNQPQYLHLKESLSGIIQHLNNLQVG